MENATFMDVLSQLRPANILHMFFLKKIEFRISSAKEQSEQTALKDAADVASQSIESTSSGYHSHISEKNKR